MPLIGNLVSPLWSNSPAAVAVKTIRSIFKVVTFLATTVNCNSCYEGLSSEITLFPGITLLKTYFPDESDVAVAIITPFESFKVKTVFEITLSELPGVLLPFVSSNTIPATDPRIIVACIRRTFIDPLVNVTVSSIFPLLVRITSVGRSAFTT